MDYKLLTQYLVAADARTQMTRAQIRALVSLVEDMRVAIGIELPNQASAAERFAVHCRTYLDEILDGIQSCDPAIADQIQDLISGEIDSQLW